MPFVQCLGTGGTTLTLINRVNIELIALVECKADVNGGLHTPAALTPGKVPPVCIG